MNILGNLVINVNTKLEKRHLKKHIQSINEDPWYPCNKCEYKETEKGQLKKHIGSIHYIKETSQSLQVNILVFTMSNNNCQLKLLTNNQHDK